MYMNRTVPNNGHIVDMGFGSFWGVHGVHGGLDRRTCGWELGLWRDMVTRLVVGGRIR